MLIDYTVIGFEQKKPFLCIMVDVMIQSFTFFYNLLSSFGITFPGISMDHYLSFSLPSLSFLFFSLGENGVFLWRFMDFISCIMESKPSFIGSIAGSWGFLD